MTTTIETIRENMETLIHALTPTKHAGVPFRVERGEVDPVGGIVGVLEEESCLGGGHQAEGARSEERVASMSISPSGRTTADRNGCRRV